MGDKSIDNAISKYQNYMREIKIRTEVIRSVISKSKRNESLTGFWESDIELSLLQIRKCLELIMFSSTVAHYHAGVKLQKGIYDQEWNATKILHFLSTVNSEFFPKPLNKEIDSGGGMDRMVGVDGALTKEEFRLLYDRVCGPYLHASRKSQFTKENREVLREIDVWLTKIVRLLNSHWVMINDEITFAVLMKSDLDGDVQVSIFKKIA